MYITEQNADGPLRSDLNTFKANGEINKVALALTTADLTTMTTLYGAYSTALDAATAAKAAAKAATTTKNTAKKAAKANVAAWSKTWHANPAITDALLDVMMLAPHNVPASHTPPTTPLDLVASGNGDGLISLKWKRNGNKSGTIFNIESAEEGSGPWTIVESTTKAKMDIQGTPGVTMWFRVVAKRDGQTAPASSSVAVYGGGSSSSATLQIAA